MTHASQLGEMLKWSGLHVADPGPLLSASLTLPLVSRRQAPGWWWCLLKKGGKLWAHVSPAAHTHMLCKSEVKMLLPFRSTVQLVTHSLLLLLLLVLPERQTVPFPGLHTELAQPGSASSEEARGGTGAPEHRHPYSGSVESYASVWVRWQKDVTSPWRASCSWFIAPCQWSPKVGAVSVCVHGYFNAFSRCS